MKNENYSIIFYQPLCQVPAPPRRSAVLWTGLGPGLGVVDCVVVVVEDVVGSTGDSSEQKLMEGWTGPLTAFSLSSIPKQELETGIGNRKWKQELETETRNRN